MKKAVNLVITFCTLVLGVFLLLTGGAQFLKMNGGAKTLEDGESFSQAQGKYIAYDAAYPIASYGEEYYSGDPDRVRTMGYVVYDEKRQEFLYAVVPEQSDGDFSSLLWNLHLIAEMRAGREMTPAHIEGTLEEADEEMMNRILAALQGSDVVEIYEEYSDYGEGSADFYDTYYGDKYGEVLVEMGETLTESWPLTSCYYIESGSVDGMAKSHIWLTFLAAVLSLLIFAVRLISLFTGGKEGKKWSASEPQSKLGQLVEAQQPWVREWCDSCLDRSRRLAYLSAAGSVVIFLAIGILVHVQSRMLLTFYLPLGLLIGEAAGILFWAAQRGQSKPYKILGGLEKSIRKELPSPAEQELFAEDILEAGPEWAFREKSKETLLCGTVGGRYWAAFSGAGAAVIVDSSRLAKIETETVSGQVRSGKVRVSYVSYAVRFFYRNSSVKKGCDKALSFNTQDNAGHFMLLAKKRVGDGVEITAL
ncbi:MAG: hypothetical protein NC541_13690 [bacterium]|nr:hypothetical protein [bacterium]